MGMDLSTYKTRIGHFLGHRIYCELDPIPSWLVRTCLDVLLPLITCIVNSSLTSATMPDDQTFAILKLLWKKPGMNLVFLSFMPVSNLSFIFKLIERVVVSQTKDHIQVNDLHDPMQSDYKEGYSTETALLKVQNDLLMAKDNQKVGVLVMLDLSTAFDTVDHYILLHRLSERAGIKGKALQWFSSYIKGRKQSVHIGKSSSDPHLLEFEVPQVSPLEPYLFTIYLLPLGDINRKRGVGFQLYADDDQYYMASLAQSGEHLLQS